MKKSPGDEVIVRTDQIRAEWLTGVLVNSGALETGGVASFAAEIDERELSTSVRLKVSYTPEADGEMPRKLFLKMVKIDMEDEFFGPSEVNYYVRNYVGVAGVPIPRCYHAAYAESLGRYHILMDDLAETHVSCFRKVPTLEDGFALAEGLAAMHAHWWGKERIEQAGDAMPGAEKIKGFVGKGEAGVSHILEGCSDQLKPDWSQAIEELYAKHPLVMIERAQDANGFTLIHGDTNLNNILVPREGVRPLYIIDRQPFNWSLTTWLGVYDLAYTMVLKWASELRREYEKPILRHYHEELIQRGVSGYTWEQLWEDYRLSAVMGVYVATEWCRGGLNRKTLPMWMPMLQRSMTAFDDLECSNLWL